MTRLSVIIPAYNYDKYIQDCIDSVKACGLKDVEIIVVDDGSTDKTPQILGSMEGIKYVRQENKGLPASRNIGFSHSTGKYIAFLDADDQWIPGVQREMLDLLDDHPEVGMIFADAQEGDPVNGFKSWIRAHGQEVFFKLPYRQVSDGFRIMESIPFFRRMVAINAVQISAVIMRREAFIEAGQFDTERTGSEDWELWLRMIVKGVVGYLDKPMAMYRQHADSMSKNKDFMIRGFCASLEKIKNKDLPIGPPEIDLINERLRLLTLTYGYIAFARGEYATARVRLWQRLMKMGPDAQGLLYLAASLLPAIIANGLKKIKQALKND